MRTAGIRRGWGWGWDWGRQEEMRLCESERASERASSLNTTEE